MKSLSYIIPVYNVERYLKECIESLYQQDLPDEDFEVIAINDGSTDSSLEILQALAERHSNIIVRTQKNRGLSATRNAGLDIATGEYVLFVDSDDIIIPHTIKYIIDVAKQKEPDIIRGKLLKLNDESIMGFKTEENRTVPYSESMSGREGFLKHYDPNACYAVLNCCRREFLIENDLRFVEGMYFEDVANTAKEYLLAKSFVAIDLPFYIYRQQPTSIMATINERKLKDLVKAARMNMDLLPMVENDKQSYGKLTDAVFCSLNIVVWYLTHHRSAYIIRKNVINYINTEFSKMDFCNNLRQHLQCLLIKYIPGVYIKMAYLATTKKYD